MKYGEKEVIAIKNLLYRYKIYFNSHAEWEAFMDDLQKILGL